VSTLVRDDHVPARAPWAEIVPAGMTLRIIDLHGNQAVDCIVYDADDHAHRYSAAATMAAQRNIFLVPGTVLLSNEGEPMADLVASTCAYHDTIGGACSRESNTLRYGHHTAHQHACVDSFLHGGARHGLSKRDLVSNINWFMNVPVEGDGTLGIVDGISAPGLSVDLLARIDLLVLISNCPQINNPCNGFDPTPIQVQVWEGSPG
jgi:urea carboxylase-associated protein 1